MRRLIMWNLITLDGFFEGPEPWSLDWHMTVWGDETEAFSLEQLDSADGLVFGRRTWEGMADAWIGQDDPVGQRMNAITKFVATRQAIDAGRWANTTVLGGDAAEAVRALKEGGDRNLLVFGSADLSSSLLEAGLFDEIRIGVAPVVLGSGHPLFARGVRGGPWRLREARQLKTGGALLFYDVVG